jgi:hypothetical protein
MAPSWSTFFWVNTNPQSVAGGSREETLKRIRSHVMSEHNRKKRLESTRRYKSKTWKSLAYRPTGATSRDRPAQKGKSPPVLRGRDSPSFSSSASSVALSKPTTAPSVRSVRKAADDSNAKSQAVAWQYPVKVVGTPSSPVGQGAGDPFNSTQVQLSGRMLANLQFCK